MSNRVLYLSYDGMTDPLGQSQVLPYIIGLIQKGYQFSLISFEKPDMFASAGKKIKALCKEHNIDWHPQLYTKKPPVLSTIKDVMAMQKIAEQLHKKQPFQIVHCRSYLSAIVGINLKKKYGVKMVFDMRGFWADERVDGGLWSLKNPLYKRIYQFFKKKEKQFLERADYTISLTHNAKNILHSWSAIAGQPVPVQVIPCCADLDLFNPQNVSREQVADKKNTLGITPSATVLSYIGSIGTWYMLQEMLQFFKANLAANPHLIFLIITKDDAQTILQEANNAGIASDKIIITGASRNEMPLYISLCDVSLFFIKPAFSKKASSPTKQGEIMAMGKPIICNTGVGDTDWVVKKYKAGALVENFTPENYLTAMKAALHMDCSLLRQGATEYFSLTQGVEKYNEVYTTLLKKAKANEA